VSQLLELPSGDHRHLAQRAAPVHRAPIAHLPSASVDDLHVKMCCEHQPLDLGDRMFVAQAIVAAAAAVTAPSGTRSRRLRVSRDNQGRIAGALIEEFAEPRTVFSDWQLWVHPDYDVLRGQVDNQCGPFALEFTVGHQHIAVDIPTGRSVVRFQLVSALSTFFHREHR
jgi:hypothetical protein